MICPGCKGSQLKADFGQAGIVFTCLDATCGITFRDAPAATGDEAAEAAEVARPARARPVVALAPTQPASTGDVIKLARRQLRELNVEISRLKKLEKQRDALRRLLAAADKKPEGRAVVRELRTNTGR